MTDQDEQQSSFARWEQPAALGRRGLVVVVVIPFLIAALGFGLVSWRSGGGDTEATTLRVPTTAWIPGQAGGSEPISGRLIVDEDQCVRLEGLTGRVIVPIWPAGFTARLSEDGVVSLYGGNGDLIARRGELVEATGVIESAQAHRDAPCVPSAGDVAVVQSSVTRGS